MKHLAPSLVVLSGALSLAASSSSVYNTSLPGVTWDNDAWTLTSATPNNSDWYGQSFVSNGYIGASFASTGPFPYTFSKSSVDGGPYFDQHVTFGTIAGFFDRQPKTTFAAEPWLWEYGWESAIAGIPAWGAIVVDLGHGVYLDSSVDQTRLSNVVLQQNYKSGYARYSYTWTPPSGTPLDVSYLVFADKGYPNRAHVQLSLSAASATKVTIVNLIDGTTALRSNPAHTGRDGRYIYSSVQPSGVSNVTAWIYSTIDGPGVDDTTLAQITGQPYITDNPSTIAQGATISLVPGQPVNITKYVGIASTDAFPHPTAQTQAHNESLKALGTGFESAFEAHVQEWDSDLPLSAVTDFADPATGVIPDALVERQIATVVAAAVLIQGTVSASAVAQAGGVPIDIYGLGVCGLLSDCYGGQRYWDQDIWMGPYMFATNPAAAKQIAQSRVAFYAQSQANIQTAFESSKRGVHFSPGAANYAWSTGRDGNCTAFAPCWDYEYHINGDIVKGFIDYWAASGDAGFFKTLLLPITNSIATFFSDLMELDSDAWTLTNMTDPDEFATSVNNGAYTMSIIQYTMRAANYFNQMFQQSQNDTWAMQAAAVEIPTDNRTGLILEYTGMPDSILIKQADVIMLTYPLNNGNNASLATQQNNLAFYAAKQALDGPGMTWAIYSIDWSALASSGCPAYTYDLYAWTPYRRAPWFTFSEQMDPSNGGAYPFHTGLGGFLQIDLMGYLGLRFGPTLELQVYPNLPPQIPYLRYPVFHWQGWPIAAKANQTHTTLRRSGSGLNTANQAFASAAIPIRVGRDSSDTVATLQLEPNSELVIENINSASNTTLANNILQCRPVVSSSGGVAATPGQFPQAAIDGAPSTIWYPTADSGISSMTVSLEGTAYAAVDSVVVQWTNGAASNASVMFYNGTDVNSGTVVALGENSTNGTTTVNVAGTGVWTGQFATLKMTGQTGQSGQVGVAEWAVII